MKKISLFKLLILCSFLIGLISCKPSPVFLGKWNIDTIHIDTTNMKDTLSVENFFALFFWDSISEPKSLEFLRDSIYMADEKSETISKFHYNYEKKPDSSYKLNISGKESQFRLIDENTAQLKVDVITYYLRKE